jgi:hypothetical protein
MRLLSFVSLIGSLAAVWALAASAVPAATASSPTCLRGEWHASHAETKRVLRALVPVDGIEPRGKLYMIFRNGTFQYGSTSLVLKIDLGDAVATARARFFTLQRYSARAGSFTTTGGTSTIEYGQMTATSKGKTHTVDGPPPKTTRIPGGSTPFQCRGNTLKVRLPRFASLGWITLQRA